MNNKAMKLIKATEITTLEDRVMTVAMAMVKDETTVIKHDSNGIFVMVNKVDGIKYAITYCEELSSLTVTTYDNDGYCDCRTELFYAKDYLHARIGVRVKAAYAAQVLNKAFKHYFK